MIMNFQHRGCQAAAYSPNSTPTLVKKFERFAYETTVTSTSVKKPQESQSQDAQVLSSINRLCNTNLG